MAMAWFEQVVQFLASSTGFTLINSFDSMRKTAMHLAAANGHDKVVAPRTPS